MSFSSLMLLDRILEETIDKKNFDRDQLIKISVVEEGLKFTQGDREEMINLNPYPDIAPLNIEKLKEELRTVVERKLDQGSFLRIVD